MLFKKTGPAVQSWLTGSHKSASTTVSLPRGSFTEKLC